MAFKVDEKLTLEAEFGLQQPIQGLAVLATIGVVDALIRTHYRRTTSQNGIIERPEIQLMHSFVVNVGRHSLGILSLLIVTGISVCLLLVSDVVLQLSVTESIKSNRNQPWYKPPRQKTEYL